MNLEVRNLTAGYGDQPIVFDVSAQLPSSKITAFVGPNGAGKSTFIKALFGQAKIFEGRIYLDGEEQPTMRPDMLVKHGIAYVPQLANVFSSLSVRENLEIGTYVRSGYPLERVFKLFPELKPILGKQAGQLSGGQRNMLAVGRALMSNPGVILLDEATAGLSPQLADGLWQHLVQLASEGLAVVVVEQNVAAAMRWTDYVFLLTSGRVRLQGPTSEVAASGDLDRLFLEPGKDMPSTEEDSRGG